MPCNLCRKGGLTPPTPPRRRTLYVAASAPGGPGAADADLEAKAKALAKYLLPALEQMTERMERSAERSRKRSEKRTEKRLELLEQAQIRSVELLMLPYLKRKLGERAGQWTVFTHARSIVAVLLPGPQRSEADMAGAVAALVDWLAEEDRGFLAVLVAEMQVQIALLKRSGLEQAEGKLAEVLVSAHSELVERLPVPWARAASAGVGSAPRPSAPHACTNTGAAAPPLLPDLATDALRLIGAARQVREADRRSRGVGGSTSSDDDEPDDEEQPLGWDAASRLDEWSPPGAGARNSGAMYGRLQKYLRGTPDERRRLLQHELCMPALSSLQPSVSVLGSRSGGGASESQASGGGASGGRPSGGGGGGGFCPSPAVSELEVDSLSLRAFRDWAELTVVEAKTSGKGTSAAIPQLKRSATILLCAWHAMRTQSAVCREQLPADIKASGVVAWAAADGNPAPEPVALHPACGPVQVLLDVDVLAARDMQ